MSSSDDIPSPSKSEVDAPSEQQAVLSDAAAPSEESPEEVSNDEGNSDQAASTDAPATASPSGDWQAIWAPSHNAYYFYNTVTQETTWTNPLQQADNTATSPTPSTSTSPPATYQPPSSSSYDIQVAALAQGIDPSLAYLDPSLAAGPSNPAAFTYTAKFNARTGAFARADARDPTHLSEFERAKRMSEFYFDVGAWEQEVDQRHQQEEEEAGKKRKKPSKKDLVSSFCDEFFCTGGTHVYDRIASESRRDRRRLPRQHGCVHRRDIVTTV